MAAPLTRILIVGGGTAAWMAAVHLNRSLRSQRCSVTVVETPGLGTVGVAQAAMPSLGRFLGWLGVDEASFMRRCSATFSLGTRFTDWADGGQPYWHPIADGGTPVGGGELFRSWLTLRLRDAGAAGLDRYSLHALLGDAMKGPRPLHATSAISESGSYGYHLDPAAFSAHLREIATGEGAVHVYGTVRDVERDARGWIAAVDIGGGRRVSADLYLDCTGRDSLLAGEALGDPWIDWADWLLCDRAIEMPLPGGGDLAPYTQSAALAAGWMWHMALAHRTGCGYVYSSAHVEPDAALKGLLARAGLRRARSADPRLVKLSAGRRTSCWVGNCVAIGAAAGCVEPLEPTAVHLMQRGIELLLEHLPDAGFATAALSQSYNRAMAGLLDGVRDFTILHYHLSRRDERFWRDARAVALPESLGRLLDGYDASGEIPSSATGLFSAASHYFVLAGGNRLPSAAVPEVACGAAHEVLGRIRERNMVMIDAMATHSELIEAINRPVAGDGLDGLGVPNASWR